MLFQYYCHIYSIQWELIILVLVNILNIKPSPFHTWFSPPVPVTSPTLTTWTYSSGLWDGESFRSECTDALAEIKLVQVEGPSLSLPPFIWILGIPSSGLPVQAEVSLRWANQPVVIDSESYSLRAPPAYQKRYQPHHFHSNPTLIAWKSALMSLTITFYSL